MTLIFAGSIGRSGLGGQAWANLQYLIGLRALGHDVYYLEDCGESSWVYHWEAGEWTTDIDYPAACVRDCLEPFGFAGNWLYRTDSETRGMPLDQFVEICSRADVLIMRALPLWVWREEYARPQRRIFIDVDPGFTQVNIASGDAGLAMAISRCERIFTFGQNIGDPDCSIPTNGWRWIKTVPPVALSEWPHVEQNHATHFTSIMRWDGFKDSNYEGVRYGQKEMEFPKFFELPRKTGQAFRLALNGPELAAEYGWEIVPGEKASRTPALYQDFIQKSRAEFGVAKHGYVQMRGGWFSDRSVCYLASGKPVLVQDTGLKNEYLNGKGFLIFRDLDDAARGVADINADYENHRRHARRIAEEYFSADKVLPALLEQAME